MGLTSSTGISAALLARHGVAGPADAFESPRGMINLFNDGVKNETSLDFSGNNYSLENPGIAFKLYPVCSAAQAAAEALNEILTGYSLKRDDVSKVVCEVTPLVAVSLVYPKPENVTQAQFSMPFALGCILAFGRLGVAQLSEETLKEVALQEEMQKIEMIETQSLSVSEHDRIHFPEGSIVTLIKKSNEKIRLFKGAATGMPVNPMSDEQLGHKFISCASPPLKRKAADALLKRLQSIEKMASIKDLFAD